MIGKAAERFTLWKAMEMHLTHPTGYTTSTCKYLRALTNESGLQPPFPSTQMANDTIYLPYVLYVITGKMTASKILFLKGKRRLKLKF
uniref:Uncharacterized protein n=1 Tax=Cucumis sativus TaxID=3659 RepID=A0A0A0LNZ3_CUCSA